MQKIDSPFSSLAFAEATDALGKVIKIQKDLFVMSAELRAWKELKRIFFGVGMLFALNLALGLTFGWISVVLYLNGWRPGVLALISLIFFGSIAAICLLKVLRLGKGSPS